MTKGNKAMGKAPNIPMRIVRTVAAIVIGFAPRHRHNDSRIMPLIAFGTVTDMGADTAPIITPTNAEVLAIHRREMETIPADITAAIDRDDPNYQLAIRKAKTMHTNRPLLPNGRDISVTVPIDDGIHVTYIPTWETVTTPDDMAAAMRHKMSTIEHENTMQAIENARIDMEKEWERKAREPRPNIDHDPFANTPHAPSRIERDASRGNGQASAESIDHRKADIGRTNERMIRRNKAIREARNLAYRRRTPQHSLGRYELPLGVIYNADTVTINEQVMLEYAENLAAIPTNAVRNDAGETLDWIDRIITNDPGYTPPRQRLETIPNHGDIPAPIGGPSSASMLRRMRTIHTPYQGNRAKSFTTDGYNFAKEEQRSRVSAGRVIGRQYFVNTHKTETDYALIRALRSTEWWANMLANAGVNDDDIGWGKRAFRHRNGRNGQVTLRNIHSGPFGYLNPYCMGLMRHLIDSFGIDIAPVWETYNATGTRTTESIKTARKAQHKAAKMSKLERELRSDCETFGVDIDIVFPTETVETLRSLPAMNGAPKKVKRQRDAILHAARNRFYAELNGGMA